MRKSKMVQQKNTEWSVLETTTSCITDSGEEEKEISKNRTNPKCGQRRRNTRRFSSTGRKSSSLKYAERGGFPGLLVTAGTRI